MRCHLREFLALKRTPLLGNDNEHGVIAAMRLREPDWNVASILAHTGRLRWLDPAALEYVEGDVPSIRLRSAVTSAGAGPSRTPGVDADALLGKPVLPSSNDEFGGRIDDLLINVRDWCLKYFVVDNGQDRVLLHASWITGLSADAAAAIIDRLPARSLLTAPRYRGVAQLTPGFLDTIYRHYTHREFNSPTG